jgi:hypothetical protein
MAFAPLGAVGRPTAMQRAHVGTAVLVYCDGTCISAYHVTLCCRLCLLLAHHTLKGLVWAVTPHLDVTRPQTSGGALKSAPDVLFVSPATFSTKCHTFPQRDCGCRVAGFKPCDVVRGIGRHAPSPLGGLTPAKWGTKVPSAKDYRHYAQQCLRFADESEYDEDRETFLEVAQVWTQLGLFQQMIICLQESRCWCGVGPCHSVRLAEPVTMRFNGCVTCGRQFLLPVFGMVGVN